MNNTTSFKTGFDAIDDELSPVFIKPYSLTCVGALQHNYKTGLLLESAVRYAKANNPSQVGTEAQLASGKKPAIIIALSEDTFDTVIGFLYKNITGSDYRATDGVDLMSVIREVDSYFAGQGYALKILSTSIMAHDFDFALRAIKNSFHDCEPRLMVVDNFSRFRPGSFDGPRDKARAVRDLLAQTNGAVGIISHDLASDGVEVLRSEGEEEFLPTVSKGGFWSGERMLGTEVDNEIYIHLTKGDKSGLRVMRGKNKGNLDDRPTTQRNIPFNTTHSGLVD